MRKLSIIYGQVDPEAKAESELTATDRQPWSDTSELKRDDITVGNYMTCEHNQAILDGSMSAFPDNPSAYQWGWVSESMSDDSGNFKIPPTLEILFDGSHKSNGITLRFYPFSDDYANRIRVTWYDNTANNVIHSGVYTLDSNVGTVYESVAEYKRIKIEMLSTNIRRRRIWLYGIDFGTTRVFHDTDINTASILEEVDPISDTVSINTLNFQIKTNTPEFSLVSGNDEDNMLMRRQMLTVTADNKPFGVFFLQSWKDPLNSGKVFDFSAQDAVGVLSLYTYMGDVYTNKPVGDILTEIFNICFPTGLIRHRLDNALSDYMVNGWIPKCSCREALQLICFAMGAVVNTSRHNYVWIYPHDTEVVRDIPLESLYLGNSSIEVLPYYSGVDITAFKYNMAEIQEKELYNGSLPAGVHTVEFQTPQTGVSVSSAGGNTILAQSANYVTFELHQDGNVIVAGHSYVASIFPQAGFVRSTPAAGEIESVCVFDKCTIMTTENALVLAPKLFDYLKQRRSIENEIRLEDNECGHVVRMETSELPIVGTIEKLDINLRGRTKARVIGNVERTNN